MSKTKSRYYAQHRRPDILAITTFILFFAVCFGPQIWRGSFLIGGDVFFYTHPLRTVAWEMIRQGNLPLWTPQVLSGYPLLAMAQIGLGYPLTWAHLLLPGHLAEELYVLTPFILAPAFTYLYVREIGRSRVAAILAGLSFGYGGLMTNTYGMNGIPTNALMWLPLFLVFLERARQTFISSLICATFIYSASILTGHGQSFVQVGTIAILYSLYLGIIESRIGKIEDGKREAKTSQRWYPFLATCGAMLFASGLAAFQILETMSAARLSVRGTLGYEFFSAGGFTFESALQSLIAPLYHYTEVTSYQAPIFLLLALAALLLQIYRPATGDVRVFFWSGVAIFAWFLMLGGNTPVYRVLYHIPVVNLFRRPSRYAFEWTFAISVLASYGWDAISSLFSKRAAALATQPNRTKWFTVFGLALCAATALLWWRSTKGLVPETTYVMWKISFTVVTVVVLFDTFRRFESPWRNNVGTAVMLLICLTEPFILISHWWPGTAKPAARFTTPALTTRWLKQFPPEENRVYVRANGPDEETSMQPRFDALDRTALFGLQNVGGYEPLILDRYSRALGDVDFDAINPRPGAAFTNQLLDQHSHVLDLLNCRFVVAWSDLQPKPQTNLIDHEGVKFSPEDLAREVKANETAIIAANGATGDTLALVTSLANSTATPQGERVARIRVLANDSRTIELYLRAGVDTAEWAHERADVRPTIRHSLAPVFDRVPGDQANSYFALRFVTRLALGASVAIDRLEITNLRSDVSLAVWKATLLNSNDGESVQLKNHEQATQLDATRWSTEKEFAGVVILGNKRALPRAWLVGEAEAVSEEEALKRIQGLSTRSFDPRRTALLEVPPDQLPVLPGGEVSPDSVARVITYEPSRLVVETSSPTATLLMLSEIFYPGWEASIDGQPAQIKVADFLLRSMTIPAGQHRVEMRYTAPAARRGLIVSVVTLCALAGLWFYSRRLQT